MESGHRNCDHISDSSEPWFCSRNGLNVEDLKTALPKAGGAVKTGKQPRRGRSDSMFTKMEISRAQETPEPHFVDYLHDTLEDVHSGPPHGMAMDAASFDYQRRVMPFQYQQLEQMCLYPETLDSEDHEIHWPSGENGLVEVENCFSGESSGLGSQTFHGSPIQGFAASATSEHAVNQSTSVWTSRFIYPTSMNILASSEPPLMSGTTAQPLTPSLMDGINDVLSPGHDFDLQSLHSQPYDDDPEYEDEASPLTSVASRDTVQPQSIRGTRPAEGPPAHLDVGIDIDWDDETNLPAEFIGNRNHPFYKIAAKPWKDGLYHCPFEWTGCNHAPAERSCNASKSLDSHFRQYRCKEATCSNLRMSSQACKLRHEREEHGERKYMCTVAECERSTHGFKRPYNLNDHMRRIHNGSKPIGRGKTPKPRAAVEKQISKAKRAKGSSSTAPDAVEVSRSTRGKVTKPLAPNTKGKLHEWAEILYTMRDLTNGITSPIKAEVSQLEEVSERFFALTKELRENHTPAGN